MNYLFEICAVLVHMFSFMTMQAAGSLPTCGACASRAACTGRHMQSNILIMYIYISAKRSKILRDPVL